MPESRKLRVVFRRVHMVVNPPTGKKSPRSFSRHPAQISASPPVTPKPGSHPAIPARGSPCRHSGPSSPPRLTSRNSRQAGFRDVSRGGDEELADKDETPLEGAGYPKGSPGGPGWVTARYRLAGYRPFSGAGGGLAGDSGSSYTVSRLTRPGPGDQPWPQRQHAVAARTGPAWLAAPGTAAHSRNSRQSPEPESREPGRRGPPAWRAVAGDALLRGVDVLPGPAMRCRGIGRGGQRDRPPSMPRTWPVI